MDYVAAAVTTSNRLIEIAWNWIKLIWESIG